MVGYHASDSSSQEKRMFMPSILVCHLMKFLIEGIQLLDIFFEAPRFCLSYSVFGSGL